MKKLLLIIPILLFNKNTTFGTGSESGEDSLKKIFFPSAIISTGSELYLPNKKDYKWSFYRSLKFTIVKHNNLTFSFSLYEKHIFGNKEKDYYRPYRILYYPLEFLNINYKTEYGIGGFVLDHECYNIIDENRDADHMYRWYGAAFTWQSSNMYPNSFNSSFSLYSSTFIFLNNLNYYLYAGRSLESVKYKYDYIFKLNTRYDIFQIYNIVPYLDLYFTVIKDNDLKLNYTIETGSRIYFTNTYLSPFIKYNYLNDIENYNNDKGGFWSAGLKITASTCNNSGNQGNDNDKTIENDIFFKAVNGRGEYGRYLNSDYFGYRTDVKIWINLIDFNILTLNHSSHISHISLSGAADMFPRYLKYIFNNYANIKFKNADQIIQIFHSYIQIHEGNFYRENFPKYHLAGIAIKNSKMESDESQSNALSIASGYFNYKFSLGRIIKNDYYPYKWDFSGMLRINLLPDALLGPYLLPSGTYLYSKQEDSAFKFTLESGIALKTNHIFDIYYRFEYYPDIEKLTDATEKLHLLGIRFTY